MPGHVVLRQESPCLLWVIVKLTKDVSVKVLGNPELFPWVGPSEPVLGQVLRRQSLLYKGSGEGPLRTLEGEMVFECQGGGAQCHDRVLDRQRQQVRAEGRSSEPGTWKAPKAQERQ